MIQAQQNRDRKILDLVKTMKDTYSFVDSMDGLKKNRVLQDIVEQILKQTIECGYFIQEYMRHNFEGMWRILFATQRQADRTWTRESHHAAFHRNE
jgi:hypothetical protein